MVRLALLSLLLFAAPARSSDAPEAKALAVLPNFAVQTPTLSTSGKLQAGDVANLSAGIKLNRAFGAHENIGIIVGEPGAFHGGQRHDLPDRCRPGAQ